MPKQGGGARGAPRGGGYAGKGRGAGGGTLSREHRETLDLLSAFREQKEEKEKKASIARTVRKCVAKLRKGGDPIESDSDESSDEDDITKFLSALFRMMMKRTTKCHMPSPRELMW